MKGRDLTMKKMDQVDHTVLGTVGLCILKSIAFDLNTLEIMTQSCLKSRHYQEFMLKHRAGASSNADVSDGSWLYHGHLHYGWVGVFLFNPVGH